MSKSIAVVRGAFNPPTVGHMDFLSRLSNFDQVIVVPLHADPKGRKLAEYNKRCEMLNLFLQDIAIANVELLVIEHELQDDSEPLSEADLLEYIAAQYQDCEITLAIGHDKLTYLSKQKYYADIDGRFNIFSVAERCVMRSDIVREKLCRGVCISGDTTPSIMNYIASNNLYERSQLEMAS